MTLAKMFLIQLIAGSAILAITMRIFGARVALWQPIAASALAALSVFLLPAKRQLGGGA